MRTLSLVAVLLLIAPTFAAPPDSTSKNSAGKPFGLEKRVPWTTSRLTGTPDPPLPYVIERVFPKLQFDEPVEFTIAPGTERLFVVERKGPIYSFPHGFDGERPDLMIDLSAEIEGVKQVFGLAFHPDFEQNRYCYICYVLNPEQPDGTWVSRFTVANTDPPTIDAASEQKLLTWKSGGHNGGSLQFGPRDGYLYISTGDGGPAFPPDPLRSGQDVTNLLASILRIDVDHADDDAHYRIPEDNPFVELDDARGEVWAYGLRNPWRMSFDPVTGDLWVGDVGWELWEMVYRIERGGNYGWSLVEARQPVHREGARGPTPILPPTMEHSHTESRSITGGYVYRGSRLPDLVGAYIYGDYVTGKIWGLRHDGKEVTWAKELATTPIQIICFGVDQTGELYVVGYDGTIHRLVSNPAEASNESFPTRLSETGLFASVAEHVPAPGVIPYSINAVPWTDGAVAERFVAVPGELQIGVHEAHNVQKGTIKGAWNFPENTVLAKTISLDLEPGDPASRRRLETQILHMYGGTWRPYNYVWNDEQTDALLDGPEGSERTFTIADPDAPDGRRQQTWRFASRAQCLLCHTTRGGSVYGFTPEQLDREHDYGGIVDEQLRTLAHINLFEEPPPTDNVVIPNPHDPSQDLNERARAYLHVNCSHCHLRGGGGTAAIEIRYELPLKKTNLLASRPTQGTFGIHQAQVVSPGDPYRSVLFYRMAKLGRGRMPHFGSTVVDDRGLKLLHDWIEQLPPVEDTTTESTARLRAKEREALAQLREPGNANAKVEVRTAMIDNMLSTTSGGLMALWAVIDGRLPEPYHTGVIRAGTVHTDQQIRDLFERFLPEAERTKTLGHDVKPDEILALASDPARGREMFHKTAGLQCRNCHKINGEGRELGPDLSKIGKKYDRSQLLESILQPSKVIDPKYIVYLVETKEGRVHSGLLVERTEEAVLLKDTQNNDIRIAADDVELMVPQRASFMPELLVRDMTAQQLADLLAYLDSLE